MVAFATIFWECASKNLTWSHLCECMVCAAPKRLLHTARAAEPLHIVEGVRFHWSREERRFQCKLIEPGLYSPRQHEREGVEPGLYSPRQHEREGARRRRSAKEDFQKKIKKLRSNYVLVRPTEKVSRKRATSGKNESRALYWPQSFE